MDYNETSNLLYQKIIPLFGGSLQSNFPIYFLQIYPVTVQHFS